MSPVAAGTTLEHVLPPLPITHILGSLKCWLGSETQELLSRIQDMERSKGAPLTRRQITAANEHFLRLQPIIQKKMVTEFTRSWNQHYLGCLSMLPRETKTLFLTDFRCNEHKTPDYHVEQIARMKEAELAAQVLDKSPSVFDVKRRIDDGRYFRMRQPDGTFLKEVSGPI